MNKPILVCLLLTVSSSLGYSEDRPLPNVEGRWRGEAKTQTEHTRLLLNIVSSDNGLRADMTLLDIGVMGWPAKSVRADGNLEVVFPSDSGDQVMAFSLEMRKDGEQQLVGTWSEKRFKAPAEVTLVKVTDEPPLTEKPASIKGPTGLLSAAVILPSGEGPYAAVVHLHGAGPQPKDASRFAARELARNGIASIIFDKRGVGSSKGQLSTASFHDLADDAVSVAKHLLALSEISSVGFVGHSQGGWIGPLAATKWKSTAFVITSAGPAVPPSREAHWDFVLKLRDQGVSESDIELARQLIDHWHEGVRSDNWVELKAALKTGSKKPWFKPSGLAFLTKELDENFVKSYRLYMDYDPIPALKALTAPMLAILAPSDESIDSQETEGILLDLIGKGSDIRIKLYPGFDHSMRTLGTGNKTLRWPQHPKDYFSVQAEFIREAVTR
jgi:alpha/beta superfamily hydrolase